MDVMKYLNRTLLSYFLIGTLIICNSCWDNPDPTLPEVTTLAVFDITPTSAIGGGNVTFDGNTSVISRGLVWSKTPGPTLESYDGYSTSGTGPGVFQNEMQNLDTNTTYYVRAYVINTVGTVYGDDFEFTTLAP
jgi:hypothetical protein